MRGTPPEHPTPSRSLFRCLRDMALRLGASVFQFLNWQVYWSQTSLLTIAQRIVLISAQPAESTFQLSCPVLGSQFYTLVCGSPRATHSGAGSAAASGLPEVIWLSSRPPVSGRRCVFWQALRMNCLLALQTSRRGAPPLSASPEVA